MAEVRFPPEFLSSIEAILPASLSMADFTAACQRPLRRSIRVNTLKISVENFTTLMSAKGWTLSPIPWCADGFWLDSREDDTSLGNLIEHLAGFFYIQEASSMMPPAMLFSDGNTFDTVLDLAAAPGSKTTQIGAYQHNHGLILANEYSASRIKVLHANGKRMGLNNLAISHFDGRVHGEYLPEQFDAVLIDAPCSGEGTIRKDPDAFKNWSQSSVDEISKTQQELLHSAFMALKPGGQLVYSTCALNGQENQQVCQSLLDTFKDQITINDLGDTFDGAKDSVTPEGYLHIWPQIYDSEGFFVAKFTKTQSTGVIPGPKSKRKFPFVPVPVKSATAITQLFSDEFGIELANHGVLYQRDKEIWLFPSAIVPMLDKMRFQRIGIKIAEQYAKGYNLQHEAAVTLATSGLELSGEQVCQFYRGQDIAMDNPDKRKGEVIIAYQRVPIGICKWVGNKLKNKLPRELVNDNPQ